MLPLPVFGSNFGSRFWGDLKLQSDFEADGTHPFQSGKQKVGSVLLDFFKNSPYFTLSLYSAVHLSRVTRPAGSTSKRTSSP